MNYIIRKSISDSPQCSVEPLQAGHIFRFNNTEYEIIDEMTGIRISYICDEIWIDVIPTEEEINYILPEDCVLNQEQLNYINHE